MALTDKAKSFLKKYQYGGDYVDPLDVFGLNNGVTPMQPMQPLSTLPNVLQRNYQQSLIDKQKQDQILLKNLQQKTSITQPTETQDKLNTAVDIMGKLNPVVKIGWGVVGLVQAQQQKKEARRRQKMYDDELKRRAEQDRINNYYQTPYTSFQQGGVVDPNLDLFSQFYAQQSELNQEYAQGIQNYYDQLSQLYTDKYKNTKRQGLSNISQGIQQTIDAASKALTMMEAGGELKRGGIISRYRERMKGKERNVYRDRMQEGGFLDSLSLHNLFETEEQRRARKFHEGEILRLTGEMDYFDNMQKITGKTFETLLKDDPSFKKKSKIKDDLREKQDGGEEVTNLNELDIYSDQFDVEKFKLEGQDKVGEVLNLEISKASQEASQEDSLVDWILQDEEPDYSPIEAEYYQSTPENTSVIEKIATNESGGDYSVVNPRGGATGKYQFMPVWAGQIRDFMGLTRDVPKERVMESFRNNPEAQDAFMNHVVQDIYMPIVEDVRPLARKYGFSDEQIIAMLHFRGEGDTKRRLRTGNFEVSQDEVAKYKNPQILDYLAKYE